ncbi:MAG: hypothetical protein J5I94_03490 [Phaeodactylibacter sp.]|nr:hypothetical protein [Phaeodactylibacter sp.]
MLIKLIEKGIISIEVLVKHFIFQRTDRFGEGEPAAQISLDRELPLFLNEPV